MFEDARLDPSTGCRLVFKQTGSLLTEIENPYEKYVSQYLGALKAAKTVTEEINPIAGRLLMNSKQNIMAGLEPYPDDPGVNNPGFHMFSFNDVECTERWRIESLAKLNGEQFA